MRILFLTQVLPYPLNAGPKVRAYHMLQYLAGRFDVTLVSFVRADDRPAYVEHLRELCQSVYTVPIQRGRTKDARALLRSVATGMPAVILRDEDKRMTGLLQTLAQTTPFDVIHADQTSMAHYARVAADAQGSSRPATVLDQHNALYLLVARQALLERGPMRHLWRRESRLLRQYEADLCRSFDRILTVTEEDVQAHVALLDPDEVDAFRAKTRAVPICIDAAARAVLEPIDDGPQVIHLGTMFWPPNVEGVSWFAREVLPLIWERCPGTQFVVAGKDPPAEVRALEARRAPGGGRVVVTGYVEDPAPLLRRSQAFVVPVRAGGGMRVKIVDGWLLGMPIVSTSQGAEGIDVRPGENILIADTPEEFAAAVLALLEDGELRRRLRENGRQWVEDWYDWRKRYGEVGRIYEELVPNNHGA